MAYTTINKSTDNFRIKLYAGNASNRSITFDESTNMQPDLVWIKSRTNAEWHHLVDVVRGTTSNIYSNATNAADTDNDRVTAFGTNGFSLGVDDGVNNASETFVAWNWKAGGAGSSNTDGNNITSTVSVNTTSGFSIVKYTGTGSASDTIGHGLGVKPDMVIMRPLGYSGAWWIVHKNNNADHILEFNTNGQANISSFGGGGLRYSTFTTSVIGGANGSSNSDLWNKSGENYIAYCFAGKTGYSKFGSYTGNGNADGPFIYTGFKPAFVLIKNKSSSSTNWQMYDNKREGYNPQNDLFRANLADAEGNGTDPIDIYSNGFKNRHTASSQNTSGDNYIYMAIAEEPLVANVGSSIPATAR